MVSWAFVPSVVPRLVWCATHIKLLVVCIYKEAWMLAWLLISLKVESYTLLT